MFNCKRIVLIAMLANVFSAQAQILSIHNNSSITIKTGTMFYAGGMSLVPSSQFTLKGRNTLTREKEVTHPAGKVYVERVYQFTNVTAEFKGMIHFNYHDSEVNNLDESGLELHIHNGINWKPVTVENHNQQTNVHSSSTAGINLHKITLIDRKSLFSNQEPLPVHLLTNPVYSGQLTLKVDKDYELCFYNSLGELLEVKKFATGWHSWNLSRYTAGLYYLANPGVRNKAIEILLL